MPRFELDRLISYDDESLLKELRRVAALVDSPYFTRADFDRLSKASSSTVLRRFKGWQNSLSKAGLGERFSGGLGGRGSKARSFTDAELLAELRAVAAKLGGKPVTVDSFNEHASINAETVRRRFGSWWAALKKADLPISNLGKRYSDEEYFENLLTVWTHYGRQPTYGEMDRAPSTVTPGAYEAKWRTWTKALLAFIERVNDDTDPTPPHGNAGAVAQPKKTPKTNQRRTSKPVRRTVEDTHEIRLGLRYEVLKRDRFRCALCGASPATHLGCVLHVDHKTPFSKGGRTVTENLRTLCQPCNVGKAAKIEE